MTENQNSKDDLFLEVHCPGKGEILSIIRHFVKDVARDMGFKEDEIIKIVMSVDEACSNVVRHAYERYNSGKTGGGPYEMKIRVKAACDHICISISDQGVGDKTGPHKGVRSIEEYQKECHGLGTYIIRKFIDKVEVQYPADSGTTVSMTKFLPDDK